MKAFRGKILVIRGGAIGDFVLTLPAIAALRKQFPEARLEVLGYPHIVQLAVAGGLADEARSIEARALAGFFARNGELSEELKDYFSEFDVIVSYLYDPDEIFQTNVRRCSPAQFLAGPHRPVEAENLPAARVFLRPLERLAIFEPDAVPRLRIGGKGKGEPLPGRESHRAAEGTHTIAVHPGSGSEKKNWPESHWAALLQCLSQNTEASFLLVGGEAEGERLERLAAKLSVGRFSIAQRLPLSELAQRLERCGAFVGHDSGISHLAAAVGLPGLILWGETPEEVWRPPSEKIVVLRRPGGLMRLTVSDVLEEMQPLLRGMTS